MDHARLKQVMHNLGWPNSVSLLVALQAVANEVAQAEQHKLVAVSRWSMMGHHVRQRWYDQHGAQLADDTVVYVRPTGPAWNTASLQDDGATTATPPPIGEPHGWIIAWPGTDGALKTVYSHGSAKPGYVPDFNSPVTVYPVYAEQPASVEAVDIGGMRYAGRRDTVSVIYQPLYCPKCGVQHIDPVDVMPHNAHQCAACSWNWIAQQGPNVYIHGGR